MRFKRHATVLCALVAAVFVLPAHGQDVTALGRHGDWVAYTYQENGQPVCYMTSAPSRSEGNYTRRGDVQMLVTHRPDRQAFNVISIVAGYEYMRDADVTLSIGGSRFDLFTNGGRAWARDAKTDRAMTQAMIEGYTAKVFGTSSRRTLTTDTFSLIGFTAAHEAISNVCKRPD